MANIDSDHYLVIAKIQNIQSQQTTSQYRSSEIVETSTNFSSMINHKLLNVQTDVRVEDYWRIYSTALTSAATQVNGPTGTSWSQRSEENLGNYHHPQSQRLKRSYQS
ncbi:hypothetical protein ACFFRR_009192 [Megaselia abdita]